MYERTIISDGASKTWAMTGWRIGFTSNPVLAPVFTRWITNTESCASQISQWAAVEAINGPQEAAETMKKSFLERRDLIVGLLNEVPGVSCQVPGGAFYVWPNVTEACRTHRRGGLRGVPQAPAERGRASRCSPTSISARACPAKASTCASPTPPPGRRSRRASQRMADFIRKNTKKARMSVWKPAVTVAAVIERDGRFLLVEETIDGRLVLNQPAGHLDPGESLVAACRARGAGGDRAPLRADRAGRHLPLALRAEGRHVPALLLPRQLEGGSRSGRSTRTSWRCIGSRPKSSGSARREHRSPLVQKCVDDFLAGRQLPARRVLAGVLREGRGRHVGRRRFVGRGAARSSARATTWSACS